MIGAFAGYILGGSAGIKWCANLGIEILEINGFEIEKNGFIQELLNQAGNIQGRIRDARIHNN